MQALLSRPFTIARAAFATRARKRVATLLVSLAFAFAPVAANASTPTDPTNGAATSLFTDVGSFFTGVLVPAIAGLLVITLGITLAIKWVKRMAKS